MRNPLLRSSLWQFAEEAAWQLAADALEGRDEIEFEVSEVGGSTRRSRATPLYCYRPLTGDFIDRRLSIVGRLPSYLPAIHALMACGGLEAYLVARGQERSSRAAYAGSDRGRAEEALRCLLARVFEDSTDFVLRAERFDAAYDELEEMVMEGRSHVEVVALLRGVTIASPEVELGEGLSLLRADMVTEAPAELLRQGDDGRQPVLARLIWEAAPGDEAPMRHAYVRLRRLLLALRLYDAAHVALARTAWTRTGAGDWQPFALMPTHSAPSGVRGTCWIPEQQEDELRAFSSLVARRSPRSGELAWALRRFELACERPRASERLTDVLLALRALLEPEGAHSGHLPRRVAMLCAIPEQRAVVAERVAHLASIERALVAGIGPQEEQLTPLVDELMDWLRALLRDVLCGHLEPDLHNVADELASQEHQPAV